MSSKNSPQQSPSQDEEGGFPKGQIWTEDSGCTGVRFSHGIPPCSMKGRSESSGVGVASGQFSPSMSFWILPWKEIFLSGITGSPLTVSNFSVKSMSVFKHRAKTQTLLL